MEYLQEVVRKYAMSDGDIVKLMDQNYEAEMSLLMSSLRSQQQKIIRPPFPVNVSVKPKPRVDIDLFKPQLRMIDQWYMSRFIPTIKMEDYWYRDERDDVVMMTQTRIPSLTEMCARRMSLYNFVYGRYGGLPYWCDTHEVMDVSCLQDLFNDFSVDNVRRGPEYQELIRMMPRALEFLYDMLGTRRYFKKLTFDYNPARIISEMNLGSSSGIRPGPSTVKVLTDEVEFNVKVSGKKLLHLGTAIKAHMTWVRDARNGGTLPLENYNVIKLKQERKLAYMGSVAELEKIRRKKREFFIPGLVHTIHSSWLSKNRMLMERGNVINVGRSWWQGGALQFAQYMNYDIPDMGWSEGDYFHHDKHINDFLLQAYIASGAVYYDYENMSDADRFLYFRANSELIFNIVVKPTCHVIPGVWSVIYGSLYSGGPETSPAGSWCTAIMFCFFLVYVMMRHPGLVAPITECLKVRLISISVYGDDHLYSYPLMLESYLREERFAEFSTQYFGCVIRDNMVHRRFLSVPNKTGGLAVVGPKFLKRYFIAGEATDPAVLPFKPMVETWENYWPQRLLLELMLY